jgi:hypothetical protein
MAEGQELHLACEFQDKPEFCYLGDKAAVG